MHEPKTDEINAGTRPEAGYEERDIDVKGLIVSTFWFFAGTTICIALSYIGFVWLVKTPLRPETKPETIPAYPNPLLQGNMATKVDIAKIKREEEQKTHTYGWVDESKGVARIPVDKAIDLIEERGLGGASRPSDSGGGL